MSLLRYGSVVLTMADVHTLRREAVYRGPTKLYDKVTLGVYGTMTPATASDVLAGDTVPLFNPVGARVMPLVPAPAPALVAVVGPHVGTPTIPGVQNPAGLRGNLTP